jgi:hypothetical protein
VTQLALVWLGVLPTHPFNEGKSAASFCRQVATWVPDMFCNFYLVKNHKIAKKSTTTKAIEKIIADLESLEFYNYLMHVYLLNLKTIKFYLTRFLLTTKLFTG